jgi:GNAT superfamily N-acetyltransferase
MDPIVSDPTPEAVIPAMEANFVDWWAYFAHAPQANFHAEPELSWLHSGFPLPEYNGVVRTRLRSDRSADEMEALIAATVRSCALPGVGMSWYVAPSTEPTDLGDRLRAQGFQSSGEAPGMVIDLAALLDAPIPAPPDLQVVRVSDAELLRQWVDVIVSSFQESETVREARYAGQVALGWQPESVLQRYLALLDGEPVAMSALFLSGGVAGIYEVVTVPQQRKRGLATSIMRATLDGARQRGYRIAVLQASPMGEPVYRRLGFSELCRFSHYFLKAM